MNVKRVQLIAAILTSGAVALAVAAQVQSAAAWRKAADADRLAINVLESAPWPIVACTESGEVLVFNSAATEYTGWSAEAIIGGPLSNIIPKGIAPTHKAAYAAAVQRLMRAGQDWTQPHNVDAKVQCRDGRVEPCTVTVRGVKSGMEIMFIATLIPKAHVPASAIEELREGQSDRWTGSDMREWIERLRAENPDIDVPAPKANE